MSEPFEGEKMLKEASPSHLISEEMTIKELQETTLQLLKANEELRKADESKQKFLSLIRNEFNNPMNVLLNLSKRLAEARHLESSQEVGKMLNSELLRMDFQLKNIFAMTELESGLLSNTYTRVNIEQMVEDAVAEFVYVIRDKQISIELELDKEIKLVTDVEKLFLILLNFVSNGCEFSREHATVTIAIVQEDAKIILSVSDDGSELPKLEDMDAIFDTFSSFNQDALRSCSGLGIGLSVARSMAQQLGGSIHYESGNGKTTFAVVLPHRELMGGENSFGSQEVFFDNFLGEDIDDSPIEF